MEQLILILLIGAFSLLKWVFDRITEAKEARQREEQLTRRPSSSGEAPPRMETDEERRIRRFMEALGLPAEEAPPVLPKRAEEPPRKATRPKHLPKLKPAKYPVSADTPATIAKPAAETAAPLLSPQETLAADPLFTNFESFPAMQTTRVSQTEPTEERGGALFPELRDSAALRRAFVLKEILGPPKALQHAER